MRSKRRTRFAASFVAIAAAGCSHDHPSGSGPGSDTATPRSSWFVSKGNDGATCWARPVVDCSQAPPGVTCNPPASYKIRCPDPMPGETFQIVTFDGTTCTINDTKTKIACPGSEPEPPDAPPDAAVAFVPRAWDLTHDKGKCVAVRTYEPAKSFEVACADYPPSATAIHESDPNNCFPTVPPPACAPPKHCNPPRPSPVKCPE